MLLLRAPRRPQQRAAPDRLGRVRQSPPVIGVLRDPRLFKKPGCLFKKIGFVGAGLPRKAGGRLLKPGIDGAQRGDPFRPDPVAAEGGVRIGAVGDIRILCSRQ